MYKIHKLEFWIISIIACFAGIFVCYNNLIIPETYVNSRIVNNINLIIFLLCFVFLIIYKKTNSKQILITYTFLFFVFYLLSLILKITNPIRIFENAIGLSVFFLLFFYLIKPNLIKLKIIKILTIVIVAIIVFIITMSVFDSYTVIFSVLRQAFKDVRFFLYFESFLTEMLPHIILIYIYPLTVLIYVFNENKQKGAA